MMKTLWCYLFHKWTPWVLEYDHFGTSYKHKECTQCNNYKVLP